MSVAGGPPDELEPSLEDAVGPATPDGEEARPNGIVDWRRTARRVVGTGVVVWSSVLVAWLVTGVLGDGLRLGALGELAGLGLLVTVVGEVVVVAGAAVRAERRAAVRGERLGSADVGLLPPRIPRPDRASGAEDG